MNGAVAHRSHEIGTLRALGFSRRASRVAGYITWIYDRATALVGPTGCSAVACCTRRRSRTPASRKPDRQNLPPDRVTIDWSKLDFTPALHALLVAAQRV